MVGQDQALCPGHRQRHQHGDGVQCKEGVEDASPPDRPYSRVLPTRCNRSPKEGKARGRVSDWRSIGGVEGIGHMLLVLSSLPRIKSHHRTSDGRRRLNRCRVEETEDATRAIPPLEYPP